jgi:hypothetical protein
MSIVLGFFVGSSLKVILSGCFSSVVAYCYCTPGDP